MGKKVLTIVFVLLAAVLSVAAQDDTSRTHVHLSTGATIASGFGRTQALSWVAPSFEMQVSDKLSVTGGFAAAGSLLGGYEVHAYTPSMAPRKHGTRMGALWAMAEYKATDRLWLWAAVMHAGGYAQPLWRNAPVPIGLTAVSGGLVYEFPQGSLLELHFHFVHDHYGTAMEGLLAHPWYGAYTPNLELYSGPWPF